MPIQPYGWLNEANPLGPPANPATATPVSSARLEAMLAQAGAYADFKAGCVSVAEPPYNALPGLGDMTAAIQAAENAAATAGKPLYFPALGGTSNVKYNHASPINLGTGIRFWYGDDYNQSALHLTADTTAAPGTYYGINTDPCTLFSAANLGFFGPGGTSYTPGGIVAHYSCLKTKATSSFIKCNFQQWYSGTDICSNHELFFACYWSQDYYDCYLPGVVLGTALGTLGTTITGGATITTVHLNANLAYAIPAGAVIQLQDAAGDVQLVTTSGAAAGQANVTITGSPVAAHTYTTGTAILRANNIGDGTQANQDWFKCQLASATFANIGVSFDNGLLGAVFLDTHTSFAPYGIYGEAGRAGGVFLNGVNWVGKCAMEHMGNAWIYDADQSGYTANLFLNALDTTFFETFPNLASEPNDYAIKLGTVENVMILGDQATFANRAIGTGTQANPTGGYWYIKFQMRNLWWDSAHYAIDQLSVQQPILLNTSTTSSGGTYSAGTYYLRVAAVDASGNETQASNEKAVTVGANGTMTLTIFAAAEGAKATGFRVYQGTVAGAQGQAAQAGSFKVYDGPGTVVPGVGIQFTLTGTAPAAGFAKVKNLTNVGGVLIKLGTGAFVRECRGTYRGKTIEFGAPNNPTDPVGANDGVSTWMFGQDFGTGGTEFKQVYQHYASPGVYSKGINAVALAPDLGVGSNVIPLGVGGATWLIATAAPDAGGFPNLCLVKQDTTYSNCVTFTSTGFTDAAHPPIGESNAQPYGNLIPIRLF